MSGPGYWRKVLSGAWDKTCRPLDWNTEKAAVVLRRPAIVMRGRFTYKLTREELVRLYADARSAGAEHAAPLQFLLHDPVDSIVERDGKRELLSMRWGARAIATAISATMH